MKKFVYTTLLLFVFSNLPGQDEDITELPDVALKNLSGESVKIRDYAKNGKITILSFWATWCAHCKKELTNISELYEGWEEEYGCELIAVSTDDARNTAKVKPYIDALGLDFEVLLDTNGDLKRAMNVTNIPFTCILDKEGKIIYKHQGYAEGDEYEIEEKLVELSK